MSGAVRTQELRGAQVARHFGDPGAEYAAAREGVGLVDRSHRGRWTVAGRAPARMLDGVLTCSIPGGPARAGEEAVRGPGAYGAVLTPKGKMVSDLRVFHRGGAEEAYLLDIPAAALDDLRAHFEKYLPPRFATVEDHTDETGMITLVGPGAAGLAAREALGLRAGEEELDALAEDEFLLVGPGPEEAIRAVRCGAVDAPAIDLLADRATISALGERLVEAGARRVGYGAWETLRVEAGRPAFGADMDADTIPVEAGIHRRAIDYGKGCYTGQEVIVRIRDRGRVNWHLRGLLLGDVPAPPAGTELFEEGGERAVGRITSAVQSPRFGQTAGLGYARREVEPPGELRLGGPEGRPVGVRALDDDGWILVEGDPGRR